jgi:transcription antitermination factor NusG
MQDEATEVAIVPGSAAAAAEMVVNWFAAYTLTRHEKHVRAILTARHIEAFLPLYAVLHRWRNGCEKDLDLPLFPNYVFVRIASQDRVRVLQVPGVVSLVSFGGKLAPLPDLQIEALRSGIGERKLEPHPYLGVGERVRIKAGPMRGLEGVLVRKKSNLRVVLALDVIMQSVAVEVNAEEVEAVAPLPTAQNRAGFNGGAHRLRPI